MKNAPLSKGNAGKRIKTYRIFEPLAATCMFLSFGRNGKIQDPQDLLVIFVKLHMKW